jgi:hypothetical protein
MAASVLTLHGAITIPAVRKDPLEIVAPRSPGLCTTSASRRTSRGPAGLVFEGPGAPSAYDEVGLNVEVPQAFQHPDAEDGAAGPGDPDDDASALVLRRGHATSSLGRVIPATGAGGRVSSLSRASLIITAPARCCADR